MRNLLITKINKYIENKKIGDEKLWAIYIKKYVL